MSKTLTQLLTEIAKGGLREKCYIKENETTSRLEDFLLNHKDDLKYFVVTHYAHNDLLMQWEIRVKKEVENVSK